MASEPEAWPRHELLLAALVGAVRSGLPGEVERVRRVLFREAGWPDAATWIEALVDRAGREWDNEPPQGCLVYARCMLLAASAEEAALRHGADPALGEMKEMRNEEQGTGNEE